MRIIKEPFLKAAGQQHPRAVAALEEWRALVKKAKWQNPADMKRVFPTVDPVKVKSGHTVYVFNIRHNEFRLIVAVHFRGQRLYTLHFFTHADYMKKNWKDDL